MVETWDGRENKPEMFPRVRLLGINKMSTDPCVPPCSSADRDRGRLRRSSIRGKRSDALSIGPTKDNDKCVCLPCQRSSWVLGLGNAGKGN